MANTSARSAVSAAEISRTASAESAVGVASGAVRSMCANSLFIAEFLIEGRPDAKRSIRLSGSIAAPCQEMDARIFQEQRHFFLNARLSAIKHSCAKTRAYMPAIPIRVDVLDQAPVRIRNSSSNCLAVFRPGLSKPSVNRSYT